MASKEILAYLYGLERHGIKPGLERVSILLSALGDPQKAFKTVHVAGTNGKGSVSSMAASILKTAGFKTGLYTSPHLSKFNERVLISGNAITDRELADAATQVKAALSKTGLIDVTFFEFTTAMAFLHFRKKKVEFAVVETGMGGRLDATNLVTPIVSVVTNIGLDHTAWLGSTIKEIAVEKAGIIKPNVPVVTGETVKDALSVLKAASKSASSPLYIMGKDFHAEGSTHSFTYSGINSGLENLRLGLLGPHQVKNAACALAAVEVLRSSGVPISAASIRKGLKTAFWPGRFEMVSKKPLVILDGAHNPAGAKALKDALSTIKRKRLMLVIGIMSDKEIGGILKELVPISDEVIVTRPKGERSADLSVLQKAAGRHKKPVTAIESVKDACKKALSMAGKADCVCVAGSLFTVGEAREYLLRVLPRV